MVAKTYQRNRIIGEPYTVSGKQYVKIETEPKPGCFSTKQVRWYTPSEYKRLYGVEIDDKKNDPYWKSQKEVLGFKNGYIWIFFGDTYNHKDELKSIGAVYRQNWKWGLSSELPAPETLPEGVYMAKLEWSAVGGNDERLLPDDRVLQAVQSVIYQNTPEKEVDNSAFIGTVGERLELTLTIEKNIETQYGRMHIMRDEDNNAFVWATQAKNWEVGTIHHIKGTVKDHKEYDGTLQTWLTRCTEIKN